MHVINVTTINNVSEMSIAAEELPLPRRGVRKKSYRAAALKKSYRAAAATRRLIKKSCRAATAMVFEKLFQISLPWMYWTRNIGSRRSDSFSLRMFHL